MRYKSFSAQSNNFLILRSWGSSESASNQTILQKDLSLETGSIRWYNMTESKVSIKVSVNLYQRLRVPILFQVTPLRQSNQLESTFDLTYDSN